MKSVLTVVGVGCLFLAVVVPAMGQQVGDYRSNGSGNWSTVANWQQWNGTSWVAAATAPNGSGDTITVRNADSIAVDVATTISHILQCTGTARVSDGGGPLTFASTGVYLHNRDAGFVPPATWNNGSTVRILGTSTAGPQFPSDRQYWNVEFESHGLTANVQLNMTGTSLTFNGNLWVGATVSSAGSSQQFRLSGSSATFPSLYRTYYIGGNIIMDSTRSILTTCGSSTVNTGDSVYVGGDVIINAGEFSLNRGSGASAWFFCNGNFSIAAGARMTRHSSSNYPAMIFFTKNGRQNWTNHGTITTGYFVPIEMAVRSGSIFNTGTSQVTGGVNFTLKSGSTLETAREGGVDSAINCFNGSGTPVVKTFESGASYTFDGTAVQVTGAGMPDTVADLTINNPTTVYLSRHVTIDGTLHLQAGQFDIGRGTGFTLGPGGQVSQEGGTLTEVASHDPAVPHTFFVDQNYPNPFNPSTTITFGVPAKSVVVARVFNLLGQEVATMFEGTKEPGVYTLHFNAGHLGSGMYFYRIQAGNRVDTKRMVILK